MTDVATDPGAEAPVAASGARGLRLGFVGGRLIRLAVSLVVLVTATFAMIHLVPGDPVAAALGEMASPEVVAKRKHELGLDLPIIEQYFRYLGGLLRGDLGTSITTHEPVSRVIAQRLPNSLALALPAFVVILVVAVTLGMAVAVRTFNRPARVTDTVFTGVTGVLNSVPEFAVATGLVAVFAVGLRALPVSGNNGPAAYVLPVASLAIGSIATLSRIARAETVKVLRSDYLRTARGRRLHPARLYLRHVLPNMMTSSLTYGGLLLSGLVAGTVIVENIFSWPGLGTQISQAVVGKDYALIQGIVLVLGLLVLCINLAVDVLLVLLDPRLRVRAGA